MHWLHIASTGQLTHYTVYHKRDSKAMDSIGTLPHLKERAVHDDCLSYLKYAVQHDLCNAHHLGGLAFLLGRYSQGWVNELIDLLVEMDTQEACADQEKLTQELTASGP